MHKMYIIKIDYFYAFSESYNFLHFNLQQIHHRSSHQSIDSMCWLVYTPYLTKNGIAPDFAFILLITKKYGAKILPAGRYSIYVE